jgi:hypothetical protein
LKKYKGQTFSFELFIVIPLFFIVLFIFFNLYEDLKNEKLDNDIMVKTIAILDTLIESPGYPKNWGCENVSRLGLCEIRGEINSQKLKEFVKLSDEQLYNSINAGEFNVFIDIRYLNDTLLNISGNETRIGTFLPLNTSNVSQISIIKEYATYENEEVTIEVGLWN